MKKIIPFIKELKIDNNIKDIISISLEHNLYTEDNTVLGDFIITGKYKDYDVSINEKDFDFNIPLDITLDEKLLKINFSKEILNINKDVEEKLIESLIYSLTELDDIDNIMIFIEGTLLTRLPNSNKNIPILLNRDYGINKIYDLKTIGNSSKVTIYYFTNIDDSYKAVPVTIFTNETDEKIEVIIKDLKSSNIYQTDLVSFLNNNTKLLDYEIEENKVKLNFNQYLLDTFYDDSLIEEVKYAITNSFKDSLNVREINIYVDGKAI